MAIGVVAMRCPATVEFNELHWVAEGQQESVGAYGIRVSRREG